MMEPLIFFGFLAAIIIVPQALRNRERSRLHETVRLALERGQPVPPQLLAALLDGRRSRAAGWTLPPEAYAAWTAPPATPRAPEAEAGAGAEAAGGPREAGVAAPPDAAIAAALLQPVYPSQPQRDFRRGVVWIAVGLGLLAAGGAGYAGLYEVGGAQEVLSLFAAFAAVPILVGLTYLALAWTARRKTAG